MAMGNDELLARLRKLLEETADTSATRDAWQELLDLRDSVPARSVRAVEAVKGFVGSWASSWTTDPGIAGSYDTAPAPRGGYRNTVGRRGSFEIDFVPYNWNTSQSFGLTGPSFVGHPISWETVGPGAAAKWRYEWTLDAGLNRLTINPPVGGTVAATLDQVYGPELTVGVPATPYFVVVTDPGEGYGSTPTTSSTGDGWVEKPEHKGSALYEIFRILRFDSDSITLEGDKLLGDYLDPVGNDPRITGINIVKPFVARLASIPDSGEGVGRERVFVTVPPEVSAGAADTWYFPYSVFDTAFGAVLGDWSQKMRIPVPKPLPLTQDGGTAELRLWDTWLDHVAPGTNAPGQLRFRVLWKAALAEPDSLVPHSSGSADVAQGRIIRITNISIDPGVEIPGSELNRVIGYHEITAHGSWTDLNGENWYWYDLRHVVDKLTNWGTAVDASDSWSKEPGSWPGITATGATSTSSVHLAASVHDPIRSLFDPDHGAGGFDLDAVESARLTGLIDPKSVGRSVKHHGTTGVGPGSTPARADRAIFDTRAGVDPGNMLDLGFRMVLYPAKVGQNDLEPDWENPIHSRELVLDSTKLDEAQYYEVDYDSGLVRLSHAPNPAAGRCDVDPNGISTGWDGNVNMVGVQPHPIVLYAAFVPYSMEGGQGGVGIRVTGGDLLSANLGVPDPLQHDIIGDRTPIPIDLTWMRYDPDGVPGTPPLLATPNMSLAAVKDQATDSMARKIAVHAGTFQSGPGTEIAVDPGAGPVPHTPGGEPPFPMSGTLMIVDRASGLPYFDVHKGPSQAPIPDQITYEYISRSYDLNPENGWGTGYFRYIWVFEGLSWDSSIPTWTIPDDAAIVVRHREDVQHRWDTTYGDSARPSALRFKYATLDYNMDGSVTVMPTAVAGPAEELRAYFPLAGAHEVARLHLDRFTGRWTTDDPPHFPTGHLPPLQQQHEVGIEVSRGRLFTAFRSDLGTVDIRKVRMLATQIAPHAPSGSATPSALWRYKTGGLNSLLGAVEGDGVNPVSPPFMGFGKGIVPWDTNGNTVYRMLSAVVEGGVWTSRGAQGNGITDRTHQYCINFGPHRMPEWFFEGDFGVMGLAPKGDVTRKHLQGPANPINWVRYAPQGYNSSLGSSGASHDWTDVVSHYGSLGYSGLSVDADPEIAGNNRLYIAGRQTWAVPAKPYIAGTPTYPVTIPGTVGGTNGAKLILTLRSADPRMPDGWTTFEFNANEDGLAYNFVTGNAAGDFVCNNSDELASCLNATILANPGVAARLIGAGFLYVPSTEWPSVEPWMLANNHGEFAFVWVGDGDPRHAALVAAGEVQAGQILLLCGGGGSVPVDDTNFITSLGSSQPSKPLYNVQVEVGTIGGTDFSSPQDLCGLLGGEFVSGFSQQDADNSFTVPTCGLFWGGPDAATGSSIAHSGQRPTPSEYGQEDTFAYGNTLSDGNAFGPNNVSGLGFHSSGFAPLGHLLGSHELVGTTDDGHEEWVFRLSSGSSDPSYGDQGFTAHPALAGANPNADHSSQQELYHGRWAWPSHDTSYGLTSVGKWDAAANPSEYSSAGFLGAHVSYGVETYGEERFWSPLEDWFGNPLLNRGPLLAVLSPGSGSEGWSLPEFSYDDVAPGDIIAVTTNDNLPNSPAHWVTRVVSKSTDPKDQALWVMVWPKATFRDLDGPPENHLGEVHYPWTDQGALGDASTGFISQGVGALIPTPASTSRAAVSHLLEHTMGEVHDSGDGLSTPGARGIGAVHVGAGRLSIFSRASAAPTGIAFHSISGHPFTEHTPLEGEPDPAGHSVVPPRLFSSSVFLEAGVFTTTARFGLGGLDSAGLYDHFKTWPGRDGAGTDTAPQFGGVGGLRVSGDAHVWLRNLRPLASDIPTAFVRRVGAVAYETVGSVWSKAVASGTGPATPEAADWGSMHKPAGWGAQSRENSRFIQEATVSVAMTRADLLAFRRSTANAPFPEWPDAALGGEFDSSLWDVGDDRVGGRLHALGQSGGENVDVPVFARSLVGCYLKLKESEFGGEANANDGVWKIQGAPVITISTAAFFWSSTSIPGSVPMGQIGMSEHDRDGRFPASALVATMTLRVSRWATPAFDEEKAQGLVPAEQFLPESYEWGTEEVGHTWSIHRDDAATVPIWIADVVDPGGSPTGAPSSFHGMTLDPWGVAGTPTLPVNLSLTGVQSDYIPGMGGYGEYDEHPAGGPPPEGPGGFPSPRVQEGALLGIHDQMDHRGRSISRAFIALDSHVAEFIEIQANWEAGGSTPRTWRDRGVNARMTVFASRGGELDDGIKGLDGEFTVDSAGRVSYFGHPRRLGPGVIMDAGLGLVQATAFRSTPRAAATETVGSLTTYGRGAYPLPNLLSAQSNVGMSLPSTFNRAEFYDEAMIATPGSRLVFESPWSAAGYAANWRAALAKSTHSFSPSGLVAFRTGIIRLQPVAQRVGLYKAVPVADTIFPVTSSGIRFKSPGTIVYERTFRPGDAGGAGGAGAYTSAAHGVVKAGIPGMEIPVVGECLLLPKGPPNLDSEGEARWYANEWETDPGSPTTITNMVTTPLDIPLYEFWNASTPNGSYVSPNFTISPRMTNGPWNWPSTTDGADPHKGRPGQIMQGYRHSRSREDDSRMFYKYPAKEQIRLLDGMVIEDVSNGTFYTVGAVGRWLQAAGANNSLGNLGDGVRSQANGSLVCWGGGQQESWTEIIYDLGQAFNPSIDPTTDPRCGFGDRWDYDPDALGAAFGAAIPRRPLSGHKFRITPNVEFVPVLGPRGTDGSLLPPVFEWATGAGINAEVPEEFELPPGADAVFYTPSYLFKPAGAEHGAGDVGRTLYICGTHEYRYTGWWIIIDVRPGWKMYRNFSSAVTSDVAVLRKLNGRPEGVDIPPRRSNLDGAFPLKGRAPMLHSSGDFFINDHEAEGHFTGVVGEIDTLTITFRWANGTPPGAQSTQVVQAADFTLAGVNSAASAATFLNGLPQANGEFISNMMGAPATAFIHWEAPGPYGSTQWQQGMTGSIVCSYRTDKIEGLDESFQKMLLGNHTQLKVEWSTTTGAAHNTGDLRNNIGFHSLQGASASSDRAWGDRNNALPMVDDTYSAANGLRWVFSAPLGEENTGSYVHLTRPRLFRFNEALPSQGFVNPGDLETSLNYKAWSSGHQRAIDGDGSMNNRRAGIGTEIFRVNRCPSTGSIVLGGDCEIYSPEIATTQNDSQVVDEVTAVDDEGRSTPVIYSPLGVWGNWAVTDPQNAGGDASRLLPGQVTDGMHATGGTLDYPVTYALQPIARERIVSVSPTSGKSAPIIERGRGDLVGAPAGPQGVGPMVIAGLRLPMTPTSAFLVEPWQLIGRHDVHKTSMAYPPQAVNFDSSIEIGNANNPDPMAPITDTNPAPLSTYCWAPAGEWWQLYLPDWHEYGKDASNAPPTLRIDLTESFTQAIAPGSGLNTPYEGREPRGARLNRIWVNFGVWGTELDSRTEGSLPGYWDGSNGGESAQAVLDTMYMAFNLVLEIPGSGGREFDGLESRHPLSSGTSGPPFGGRAPMASSTHGPNNGGRSHPGGTVVIPLYCNREAGDMMPNVMERWVTAGPKPAMGTSMGNLDPLSDWSLGDYEHGFGASSLSGPNEKALHIGLPTTTLGEPALAGNAYNPVLWGGIDMATAAEGGMWSTTDESRALATVFPRSSRCGGGIRSTLTSGVEPDGTVFSKAFPHSLSAAAMTGIVVAHCAGTPTPTLAAGGSYVAGSGRGPYTCPHSFTLALTPVGDSWGEREDQDAHLRKFGRTLTTTTAEEDARRPFKVGNWLDAALSKYAIPNRHGSMLPPGARVFLEVAVGPGAAARDEDPDGIVSAGAWVGNVKLSFDVETADGTAWSLNVNRLGDEEG